jgi:hypothetical protein
LSDVLIASQSRKVSVRQCPAAARLRSFFEEYDRVKQTERQKNRSESKKTPIRKLCVFLPFPPAAESKTVGKTKELFSLSFSSSSSSPLILFCYQGRQNYFTWIVFYLWLISSSHIAHSP